MDSECALFVSLCVWLPLAQCEDIVGELIVVCTNSSILFMMQDFQKSDKNWFDELVFFVFLEFSSTHLDKYSVNCSKGTFLPPSLPFLLSLSCFSGSSVLQADPRLAV